ncbi:MAG: ribonuclease HI [Spirochaetales bacterium]|nr:ribonuclease HI [Spirochaetales bacterium]
MDTVKENKKGVQVYTDGGCSGNPGPGGWACVIIQGSNIKELSGGEKDTTNNRMELTAVINGLKTVLKDPDIRNNPVSVFTDSQYVKNGITAWIRTWEGNGWLTAAKKPVKNKDLWVALKDISSYLDLSWHWVKGHAGNTHNERCDSLVQTEMQKLK